MSSSYPLSYEGSPLVVSMTLKPHLYLYWAKTAEDELSLYWRNLRAYREDTAVIDETDPQKRYEIRLENYHQAKKLIVKFWQPVRDNMNLQERREEGVFDRPDVYRFLCLDFYTKMLRRQIGSVDYMWARTLSNHLRDTLESVQDIAQLRDDDFLQELWEDYGLEALAKMREPRPPKVESRGGSA